MEPDDLDSFEFIDYTTSGPWERFIVQIEDCLKHWGLVHNSYGVFNPNVMPTSEGTGQDLDQELALALGEEQPNSDTTLRTHAAADETTGAASIQAGGAGSLSKVYQHNATVTLDSTSYTLSYRYHPAKARLAAGVERIDLDFLPASLEGLDHHILHRWTALTHILVLSPAVDTDPLIIDLGSAKLLLSSFAIAFQNTGCNIPVFVPIGHPKNRTYTGLSIQPQLSHARDSELGLEESMEDQAIEVRFNTVVVPYPPAQYTNLSGILDLFIQRMGIEDEPAYDGGRGGGLDEADGCSPEVKDQIYVSGLFSYQLDSWRPWTDATNEVPQSDDESLPAPSLPLGPVHDPLKSLQLVARFASAPSTVYLDSKNLTDMDANQANIWIIKALFKTEEYGLLSGILEDAISSWSMENANSNRASEKEGRSYTSLLRKGARLIQGTISMVDAADVDNIVKALLSKPRPSSSSRPKPVTLQPKPHGWESTLGVERVVSAEELGLHFRHATTVPYGSLLWKMLQHLVDVISPNSNISYPTSFMGFLKALWAGLLKQIAVSWKRKEMIPGVQVFFEESTPEKTGSGGSIWNQHQSNEEGGTRVPAIDLRFNLLHQKLSMINCCIARENAERRENSADPNVLAGNLSSFFSTSSSSASSSKSTKSVAVVAETKLDTTVGTEAAPDSDKVDDEEDTPVEGESTASLTEAIKKLDMTSTEESPDRTKETSPPPQSGSQSKGEATPKAFKGLTLLETGAPLVIPKLQDPGYMTEDMIREQEDLFENLGSTAEAAQTRAEMQCAQLISDMSAFKAANLGCVLGDFIRWHSPKDWDNEKRQMSTRMADSGNFWQELWEKSDPIPANKQTPLFDHRQEAEKALSYLKALSPTQIFVQLLPTIFLLAYDTLVSHPMSSMSPKIARSLQELAQELTDFPWREFGTITAATAATTTINEVMHDRVQGQDLDLKPILAKFREVEITLGKVMALMRKFPEQYHLVERIMNEPESISVVEDGAERDCVYKLFTAGVGGGSGGGGGSGAGGSSSNSSGNGVGDSGNASALQGLRLSFPKPNCREFVIETFDPSSPCSSSIMSMSMSMSSSEHEGGGGDTTTGWHARPLQRRMYACFKDSEVRIVEAIAKDGMFM
ncbi:Rab3 GTPase-activating protein catalytic subunit-domain-containing protein [Dissophora ornata]|nr:Rab3 GTPase-activating protein catalytic subunit-domain-containing protein [Dissophora ornata]